LAQHAQGPRSHKVQRIVLGAEPNAFVPNSVVKPLVLYPVDSVDLYPVPETVISVPDAYVVARAKAPVLAINPLRAKAKVA